MTAILTAITVIGGIVLLILKRVWGKQALYDKEAELEKKLKEKQSEREKAIFQGRIDAFYMLDMECIRLSEELNSVRRRLKSYSAN